MTAASTSDVGRQSALGAGVGWFYVFLAATAVLVASTARSWQLGGWAKLVYSWVGLSDYRGDPPSTLSSRPTTISDCGSSAGGLTPSSPHPMGIHIPQEILDEIIDNIAGAPHPSSLPSHVRTLQDCSLVARAWTRRSQKHIFASVSLRPENLGSWCRVNAQNSGSFTHHVRILEVKQNDEPNTTKFEPATMEAARPYLNFPNLEVFSLSRWDNLDTFSLPRTFGHYSTPSLRSFTIIDSISNGDALLEFAALFPFVDEFAIDCAYTTDERITKTFSFPDLIRWTALRLISVDDSMMGVLDVIAGLHLQCQVLDISYELLDNPSPIMRLIQACSTTLKSMRLEQTYSGNFIPSLRAHPH